MKNKAVLALWALGVTMCCVKPANASVIMTLEQVGPDVVAMGSGTINTTDLTLDGSGGFAVATISPGDAELVVGRPSPFDVYGGIAGPTYFGAQNGRTTHASSGAGDYIGILGFSREISTPSSYISGTPLSGTATFDSTTLAGLGVTPGTYTWTWGTGVNADSLTLYAGVPAPTTTPEPASLLLLAVGLGGAAWLKARERRRSKVAGSVFGKRWDVVS
jgi:hypothetical protein